MQLKLWDTPIKFINKFLNCKHCMFANEVIENSADLYSSENLSNRFHFYKKINENTNMESLENKSEYYFAYFSCNMYRKEKCNCTKESIYDIIKSYPNMLIEGYRE